MDVANPEGGPTQLTYAGKVMGTPDYIAPEQARNSHDVDIRADLYSLGCTFFYLLAGFPPFRGTTALEKLVKHQTEPPPDIQQVRPEVPPHVAALIRQLMAKRPEQRLQTPGLLAAALDSAAAAGPLPQAITLTPGGRRTGVMPAPALATAVAPLPTAVPVDAAWDWTPAEGGLPSRNDWGPWALLGCLGLSLFLVSLTALFVIRLLPADRKPRTDTSPPARAAHP